MATHRDIYSNPKYKPDLLSPAANLPDVIPAEMRERKQWVLWRLLWAKGRWAKVPYMTNDRPAKANDPATWAVFDEVWESYRECMAGFGMEGGYEGIGFVFCDADPFCGVDLDDSLAGSKLAPWAEEILARFEPAYCEVSPSKTGLKLWCRGTWKGEKHRYAHQTGEVEVYCTGRFFTVTGHQFSLDKGWAHASN